MPFRGVSLMDQRGAFVSAARIAGANVRELCRTYAISPTTGYKWLDRAGVGAAGGLADRSRRPHRSPRRTAAELEAAVVAVRLEHPRWGGRKIHHFLKLERIVAPPHPNTVTDILRRHGLIDPVEALRHRPGPRPALSPSDARQERAVQPNPQGRADCRSKLCRARRRPSRLRSVARFLQPSPAPSGHRRCAAGLSLSGF